MTSLQAKGIIRFYKVGSDDSPVLLDTYDMQSIGYGGAPDGAISQSIEKWNKIPQNPIALNVNDRLRVTFEATATKTLDASDAGWSVPITLGNGSVSFLRHPTNSSEWDIKQLADASFTADIETPAFEMRVKRAFYLGSNVQKAFISLEDNTA